MTPNNLSSFRVAAVASVALFTASIAGAAVIPYTNSFESSGFSTTSGLTLNTGAGTVSSSVTGTSTLVSYGTEQFTNAANSSYTVSTQFLATSLGTNGGDQAVGLGLFGLNSAFTGNAANPFLLASWVFQGTTLGALRFIQVNGTNPTLGNTQTIDTNGGSLGSNGVYDANNTLTLKVTVTSTATDTYDLSLGLFDAAGTSQFGSSVSVINYVASAEPSGGYYMGLRNRIPNASGTTTLVNNDFAAVAVPEPSTYLLLGIGLIGFTIFRCRSTAYRS